MVAAPSSGVPADVLYAVASLSVLAVTAAAVGRVRGTGRLIWMLMLAAQVLSAIGALILHLQTTETMWSHTAAWAGALGLASCAPGVAALWLLVRRREPSGDRAAWLDSLLIAIGLMALIGGFVVDSKMASIEARNASIAFSTLTPMIDILVVALLLRILLVKGRDRQPIVLLFVASAVRLMGAVGANLLVLKAADFSPAWIFTLWLIAQLLTMAATSHPQAARVADVQTISGEGSSRFRFAALSVGALLIPVLLVYATYAGESSRAWLWSRMGLVSMGVVLVRLHALVRALERRSAQLADHARTDPLTGLANRRTWNHNLDRAENEPRTASTHPVVAILDVDHFKSYNDRHGHRAGDTVLHACAQAWQSVLGTTGLIARYGGEEFSVYLPAAGAASPHDLLEELRRATPHPLTVSAGAAYWLPEESAACALDRADTALYHAKANGRNRLEWADTPLEIAAGVRAVRDVGRASETHPTRG